MVAEAGTLSTTKAHAHRSLVIEAASIGVLPCKAGATQYFANEAISSSECRRTMTSSRDPCTCRHTLLVTRTGADEYALIMAYTLYKTLLRQISQ